MPMTAGLKRQIKKNLDDVIDFILQESFWPKRLDLNARYSRRSDDVISGKSFIEVVFSRDTDAWVEVFSMMDPEEESFTTSHRFRTYLGGGNSLRVRNAILLLARAIQLDNEEFPDFKMRSCQ